MRKRFLTIGKKAGKRPLESGVVPALSFTDSPIQRPLLRDLDPAENEQALEMFVQIMRVMGDYPLNRDPSKAGATMECARRRIFSLCLHGSKALQMEFYTQVHTQILGNPKSSSREKGWQLFVIAVGLFCPTRFRPIATAILKGLETNSESNEESELAGIGSARLAELESYRMGVQRRHPPSDREIDGIINQTLVIIEITIPGRKQLIPVGVSPGTTVQNVVDIVCMKMSITHKAGYTIWAHSPSAKASHPCSPGDLFMDVVAVADEWKCEDTAFYLKRLTWIEEGFSKADLVSDPQDFYTTFACISEDVRTGRLPTTGLQALRLGAILAAHDFGPARKGVQRFNSANLSLYIPKHLMWEKPEDEWIRELSLIHSQEPEKPQQDLKLKYLDMAFKLELFGAIQFPITQKHHHRPPPAQEMLTLTPKGCGLFYEQSVEPIAGQFWTYSSISLVTAGVDAFSITVGNLQRPERYNFITNQSFQIASLFREFSQYSQTAKTPLSAL